MYRARVFEMKEQTVTVFYIDYGDREVKDKAVLGVLPHQLLAMLLSRLILVARQSTVSRRTSWWGRRWSSGWWGTMGQQLLSSCLL